MNYQVQSHSYENTGGGCMVSTFQVWLADENKTMFVHVNEEGGTLATCDYINNDIEYDETMMKVNFSVKSLEKTHEYFELFRHCYIEYIKKDCKRYKSSYKVPFHILPDALQQSLTDHYIAWHNKEVGGDFETNGEEVIIDSSYQPPIEDEGDPEILAAKMMLEHMASKFVMLDSDDEAVRQKFYDLKIIIGFGDRVITLSNSAAIYTGLEDCLKYFIDQY